MFAFFLERHLSITKTAFRLLGVVLIAAAAWKSASAQTRPPGYFEAERAFEQLALDRRLRLQMLLTAAGYWPAVPNREFSKRLFDAFSRFQVETGYIPSGMLAPDQVANLAERARPYLFLWGFTKVRHPTRGLAVWVPTGLGLKRSTAGTDLTFEDPSGRLILVYRHIPHRKLEDLYHMRLHSKRREIHHYRVFRENFFAISSTDKNGVDSYERFHRDGRGAFGFQLFWYNPAGDIRAERIATLMSGSLRSVMTDAPSAPPIPTRESPAQVAAVPAPPPPPVAPEEPERPLEANPKSSSGTGFFVSRDGYILTNAHVIEECHEVRITPDGGVPLPAQILARDSVNDLALLKADAKAEMVGSLRLDVRLGEIIAVYGFPLTSVLSRNGNFTLGNVTAMAGLTDDSRHLQISAPVQAGNSGGPLLDRRGHVVGVVVSKLDAITMFVKSGDVPQNVNFAVKAMVAASFLSSRNIDYETGGPKGLNLTTEDLAERAKTMSVFISCG